jgi:hypothetical protein
MATQAEEGEGMNGKKSTLTLAEAMVVARAKSKLDKRHARYKRYYDRHPGTMQKKNRDYYQEHRDTIRARSRASNKRRRMNTVTGFVVATTSELVKVRITFTTRPAARDIAMCLM